MAAKTSSSWSRHRGSACVFAETFEGGLPPLLPYSESDFSILLRVGKNRMRPRRKQPAAAVCLTCNQPHQGCTSRSRGCPSMISRTSSPPSRRRSRSASARRRRSSRRELRIFVARPMASANSCSTRARSWTSVRTWRSIPRYDFDIEEPVELAEMFDSFASSWRTAVDGLPRPGKLLSTSGRPTLGLRPDN